MPLYAYTAQDMTGELRDGTVTADSDVGAAALLRQRGLAVTSIRMAEQPSGAVPTIVDASIPTPPPGAVPGIAPGYGPAPAPTVGVPRTSVEDTIAKRIWRGVNPKELSLFYRQLHQMLHSGMGIYQAMEMLGGTTQTPNGELRRVVRELARDLLAGGKLSQSMGRFPWLFDKLQVRMVEAGEHGGFLVDVLSRLSAYLEREYELRMQISRRTIYPKLVLLLLMLVLPIDIPIDAGTYARGLGTELLWIVGMGLPIWLILRLATTSPGLRSSLDQLKLAIPVIGTLIRKLAVARFARALSALFGAGVPISTAVAVAGEACGNYPLEMQARRIVPALEHGASLSQALETTGYFQPMFLGMVSTGESTGSLDATMEKAADFLEGEATHATNQLVVVLGVALLLVMGGLVLYKLVTVYSRYFNGIFNQNGGGGGEGE